MNQVRRIFVEKRAGYDVEARHVLHDLKENLGLSGLARVRLVHRYDIQGITDEEYARARGVIFSEPPVDDAYDETYAIPKGAKAFAIEYLPGQYDQRADSAAECVQLLTKKERPSVLSAKLVILEGDVSEEDLARVKAYLINPVEAREASMDKPESLDLNADVPPDVATVAGFTALDEAGLAAMLEEYGFAMDLADIAFCQAYFRDTEKRDPTVTELRMIDTYWSDHCRHTTFSTKITDVQFEESGLGVPIAEAYQTYLKTREELYVGRDKSICLMDLATIAAKELKKQGYLTRLDQSEEINACSIEVTVDVDGAPETYLIMFKNETHNHPTEIEPFGGAATCLGGAIRDPLSGRAYVYQAMRVTGSGDPRKTLSETLPGKLMQRKISTGAAAGYSSYGNQIGLATGQVVEIYDEVYVAKRMEIGAVIAATPKDHVVRERPAAGDVVILLGGKTGRDGCGGATGSSKAHTSQSLETCGAEVQKGNPPVERKLQRLFRNGDVTRLIKRCNDFGAGGVSVAIGELADGLAIDLDRVPKKYEGLDGTELAISESQERMAVVVAKADMERFIAYAAEENLMATKVADVTEAARLVMTWRGQTICDISRDFLNTNGAEKETTVRVAAPDAGNNPFTPQKSNTKDAWMETLSDLNVASQKGLCERFDSSIGKGTVLMPFGGKFQLTPQDCMAAKVPVLHGDTTTGTLMSYGYSPQLSTWSPFHGAAYAVVESVSKIVAAGGDYREIYLTFQEYFEKLGNDPERWGKPLAALLGAYAAQRGLKLAAIGGKDSMSGSFNDLDVPPTLVSFAVDPVDVREVVSAELKAAGHDLYLCAVPKDGDFLPDYAALGAMYDAVHALTAAGKVCAAYTVKAGGIAAAVAKMSFGNKVGVKLDDSILGRLFTPAYGDILLEVEKGTAVACGEKIGETCSCGKLCAGDVALPIDEALAAWEQPLEGVYPTRAEEPDEQIEKFTFVNNYPIVAGESFAKPRVFIPVFPGTNCEYDTAKAFTQAGGVCDTFVVRNLTPQAIEETIAEMAKRIGQSQIVMLPGGFSAGDEPEGSGKFIAAVFRNPDLKECVMELLNNRDGLMLGICNGFQALIKLGLVPYGEILDIPADAPTLTFNTIGRHVSQMAYTRVCSNMSPWLAGVKVGDIHAIPVSHGEGRFVASREWVEELAKYGQIATQYVDLSGNPTYDTRFNPNGSVCAIEGITSPCGRVLGKMGHSERIGANVAKNIIGEQDQKIFESGIAYFK